MFGLPWATLLVMTGVPAAWLIFAGVFLLRSRDWDGQA